MFSLFLVILVKIYHNWTFSFNPNRDQLRENCWNIDLSNWQRKTSSWVNFLNEKRDSTRPWKGNNCHPMKKIRKSQIVWPWMMRHRGISVQWEPSKVTEEVSLVRWNWWTWIDQLQLNQSSPCPLRWVFDLHLRINSVYLTYYLLGNFKYSKLFGRRYNRNRFYEKVVAPVLSQVESSPFICLF